MSELFVYLKVVGSVAAVFGTTVGLASQVYRQYHSGECHFRSLLNIPFLIALTCRGTYFLLTGEYILLIPDFIGIVMSILIQIQISGYLLKK